MHDHLRLRKNRPFFEINWKISEIFSEASLASFLNEIESQIPALEKEKRSL